MTYPSLILRLSFAHCSLIVRSLFAHCLWLGRQRGLGRLGRMRGKSKKNVNIFFAHFIYFLYIC